MTDTRRLIDYSSRPPIAEVSLAPATHLQNYDRVYADPPDAPAERDTLGHYIATYDALAAEHVVIKARDLQSTFGVKLANELWRHSAATMAHAISASPVWIRTRAWPPCANWSTRSGTSGCAA